MASETLRFRGFLIRDTAPYRDSNFSCRKIRRGGTPRLRHIDVTVNRITSRAKFFANNEATFLLKLATAIERQ